MTTTTDWPTGSSDHAASNVKTATIIQFVPRANPDRGWRLVNGEPFEYAIQSGPCGDEFVKSSDGACLRRPVNFIGHPWSGEDKA